MKKCLVYVLLGGESRYLVPAKRLWEPVASFLGLFIIIFVILKKSGGLLKVPRGFKANPSLTDHMVNSKITTYHLVRECWSSRTVFWIFNYNIFMETKTKNPETALQSSWILHL